MDILTAKTGKAVKDREQKLRNLHELLEYLRRSKKESLPLTREEALGIAKDLYEFEVDIIKKLFLVNSEMMWLYSDTVVASSRRFAKRPTRKQMKREVKIKTIDFAKDLLREMQYRKPVAIKTNQWRSPLVA